MPAEPLVDITRTNDYQKLLRQHARVLKAAAGFWRAGLRSAVWQRNQRTPRAFGFDLSERFVNDPLNVDNINDAELLMFRKAQQRHPPPEDVTRSLGLVRVNEVLRAKGRLQHASRLDDDWPIYAPRDARETRLLVADYHHRNGHASVLTTLANVRQRVWFTHGRRTVRSVIAESCWPCRRLDAKPFRAPSWPPLPHRVQPGRPFSAIGVDFFGPVHLKLKNHDGSTYTRKHWVVIFVCMIVRAIHMEVVDAMDTESFIRALNRFAGRRGLPHTILSDNGRQLLAARSILREFQPPVEESATNLVATSDRLEKYLREHRIRWTTITEVAPWRGGTYERLIGPVKNCLRRSIGSGTAVLKRDDFETLLISAEAIVNSRPLTHVPDTTNELPLSHDDASADAFIPPVDEAEGDEDYQPIGAASARTRVLSCLRRADDRLHRFWQLWREDYLAGLRERGYASKSRRHSSHDRQPNIGEVVLVFADNAPRACWKVARVVELLPSADNEARTARIRFANGSETRRATSHLYPMELVASDIAVTSTTRAPSQPCTGSRSPPGGFDPLFGFEEEAPEDPEPLAAEQKDQATTDAPIATRTRRRIATMKLAHWPEVLFNPGTLAQHHADDLNDVGAACRA